MTNDSISSDDPMPTQALRVLFSGPHCLGLCVDEIEVIVDWRKPAPLPHAPAGVLGIAVIRGRMLTVLDVGVLMGEATAISKGNLVALRGDEQLALAVDRVGDILEVQSDRLQDWASSVGHVKAMITNGEQSIVVLEPKELFATAMRGHERRRRRF
jgi:chemotaxis signal transduction protein